MRPRMIKPLKQKLWAVLLLMTLWMSSASYAAERSVSAMDMSVSRGQTNRLSVVLASQGDENTLNFSLCYDPSLLIFIDAVRGSDATNAQATLSVDKNQIGSGQVGLVLGLPSGQTFAPAGSKSIVQVVFQAATGTDTVSTPVMLCDSPVGRQVTGASSALLSATYSDATVTILGTCAYSLATSGASFSPSSGTGTIGITTDNWCDWNVVNTNNWIALTSATNGTGNGSVAYSVSSNTTHLARSGTLAIADQSFTIRQDPADCTYTLGFTSANYGAGSLSDTVTVGTPTGCVVTAVSGTNWITITSTTNTSPTNSIVTYHVLANPTHLARTGTVAIANQTLTISQAPANCTYTLGFNTTNYGFASINDAVSAGTLTGCVVTAVSGTNWIRINSVTSNSPNSSTVAYSVSANPTHLARTGTVAIANQTLTVSQDPAPCAYTLGFNSATYGPASVNDTVNVGTLTGCVVSAVSGTNWITITSTTSTSATNSTVGYSVSANPTHLARTGAVAIANQVLTISQDPANCTYTLGFSSTNYGSAGISDTVSVGTLTGCVVTAVSGTNWITINSITSNSPNGSTVGFSVSANPTHLGRTGTVAIANQVLTISQDPANCTYTLGFNSTNYGSAGISDTVNVGTLTGCVVTAVSGTNWIKITSTTSNTPNSSTVGYSVSANPTHLARTGTVAVANQVLTISQDPANCTYTLGFNSVDYGPGSITDTVSVGTLTGCVVTAVSGTNWITITSTTSNNPTNSTLSYSVSANPTHLARTGTVAIANQILTISQHPANCIYTLGFNNTNYGSSAVTDTVSVGTLTGCVVTAVSGTNWITINSITSNNPNSSTVGYGVSANPTHLARTGTVAIANQILTISQDPANCAYTLGFNSANYGSAAVSDTVSVGTLTGCVVSALSGTNWITITSTTSTSATNGTVGYSVSANPTHLARTGTVAVANQILTISQDPANCAYTLGFNSVDYGAGSISDTVSVGTLTGCVVTAVSGTNWITINSITSNSPNGSTVGYSVSANPTHLARTGTVAVANQVLTISQGPANCTYTLGFNSTNYGSAAINDTVSVGTLTGCVVTAVSGTNWITINSITSNSPNSSTVGYSVSANPTHFARTGTVAIANQTLTISQGSANCTYTLGFNSVDYGPGSITDTVSVGTLTGCVVTALSGTNWITINSITSNSPNSSVVGYSVSANPTHLARTGTVAIANQTLTVSQDPANCTYTLGFNSTNYGSAAVSDAVSVGTLTGCVVTAVSGTNWITINSITSTSPNSSVVGYSVSANPTHLARTGTVAIANQVLTVSQDPANCTYTLGFNSTNYGSAAISDTVSVGTLTGCVVTALSGTNWITINSITSNSPNSSTVGYSVSANPTHLARTGTVAIANQVLIVSQDPANCTYTLGLTGISYGPGFVTDTLSVGTLTGCVVTAVSGINWITVTSTTSNSPTNSTVGYSVSANPTHLARTGTVAVANQMLTISQGPANCTYTLGFNSINYGPGPISDSVSVGTLTGCVVTAVSGTNWITITSVTSPTPDTTMVGYSVSANPTHLARTGSVAIANQVLTISQDPANCAYALGFNSTNYGFAIISDRVSVSTLTGCVVTAVSGTNWIAITSNTSNSPNSSTVDYTVSANPTHLARTGIVAIANQILTISQDPANCTYTLGFDSASYGPGAIGDTVSVGTLTGCVVTAVSGTNWISIASITNNTPDRAAVSYLVAANPTGLARTSTVAIANQVLTVRQDPAPCTYTLGSSSRNYGFAATSDSVSVTTLLGCPWSAVSGANWITINSANNTTNSGSVSYTVAANPNGLARTGTVAVAGQLLAIRQDPAPCTYLLGFTSVSYGFGTNADQVSVTTLLGCPWRVVTSNSWISIISASNNTNNGTVGYTVQANPTGLARTGVVMIADQLLSVRQDPAPCAYNLAFHSANYGFGPADDAVNVTTLVGCSWTALSGANWITVTSSPNNAGSGAASYKVSANPNGLTRTGLVAIANQFLTITQDPAPCTYALGFSSMRYGPGATNDMAGMTTLIGCPWSVLSGTDWITITSAASNTNSGTISYTVAANPTGLARTGVVSAANQTLVVRQDAAPCTYALSPSNWVHRSSSETGAVNVATLLGCSWSVSNTNDWVTITSINNDPTNGSFGYTVSANPGAGSRTGQLMIGDKLFTIGQVGTACTYALSPTNRFHGPGTAVNSVRLIAGSGCAWTIIVTNDWITFTNTSGAGPSTNYYSLTANKSSRPRTGAVSLGGEVFTLTQWGTNCAFLLTPANPAPYSYGGGNATVSLAASTPNCSWNVINNNTWITITNGGTGSVGSLGYTVAFNLSPNPRTGVVTIGGEILTVSQAGFPCTYTLSPGSGVYGFSATNAQVSLVASNLCPWMMVNTNDWITITPSRSTNGLGSATFSFAVDANPTAIPRVGVVMIADQLFPVRQEGAPCTFTLSNTNDAHDFGSGVGAVALTSVPGCDWFVSNSNTWILISSGTSGTGSGEIDYAIDPNPSGLGRTGAVMIADQVLNIIQAGAPCAFGISPGLRTHGAGMETGVVNVTTLTGCPWAVSNMNSWITISSALTATDNGPVNYVVAPNQSVLGRTGVVMIANQPFTVVQVGANCSFSILPIARLHSSALETGQVAVTAISGCAWIVGNTNSWITITSSLRNTNSGTVNYTVGQNTSPNSRSGTVTIASQPFTVTQSGITCAYALSPATRVHGSGPETGQVTVTTSNLCDWSALNTNSWITLAPPASGTGNGTVNYSLLTNSGPSRSGTLVIGGMPFVVSQNGSLRLARASDMSIRRGQTNNLIIVLEALGNENAVSLSLNYDTNLLTFIKLAKSKDVTDPNASLIPNTNQAASNGRVGFLFGLSPGGLFHAGANNIVEASFRAAAGNASAVTPVTIGNTPVASDVADANGNSLPASYSNATVTIMGLCSYSLATNGASFGASGGDGVLNVTADPGCAWNVSNSNGWINTSAATSPGNGSVSYTVAANLNGLPRVGLLTIAGFPFTVTQAAAPCAYSLSPTNWLHGAGSETGLVAVSATSGCSWSASTANNWITLTSTSNGAVAYRLDANPSSVARTGSILVADQTFTVNQAGARCVYSIAPVNGVHGAGVETGTVAVAAMTGCSWNAASSNSWITILAGSNGMATGAVVYAVAINPSVTARAGVLTIAGQTFTVSQLGADCGYTLSPMNLVYGYWATNGLVNVTTSSNGCGWSVVNTNTWIRLTAGANGTGAGTVAFSVDANRLGAVRVGILNIAGQNVTISQAASPCVFSLTSPSFSCSFLQTNSQVNVGVFSSCGWSIQNSNSWINITSSLTNNFGNGTVSFTVLGNPTGLPRLGIIVIADQLFAVNQAAVPCTYNLGSTTASYGFALITGTVNLTTLSGCPWSVLSEAPWISINSAANNSGSGLVSYTVQNNPMALARTGLVAIANQVLTVRQDPAPCAYNLGLNGAHYGPGLNTDQVSVGTPTGCVWAVLSGTNWITINSAANNTNSGFVVYTVAPNPTGLPRTGIVAIANQVLTVTQDPAPCLYALGFNTVSYDFGANTDQVSVTTLTGCVWSAASSTNWITITSGTNNIGSANVSYTIANNPGVLTRTGVAVIAGQLLTVTQSGIPCAYSLSQSNQDHGAGSETGLVTVTTLNGCGWTVVNTNSWISINPTNTSGAKTAIISYAVDANPSPDGRTGVVTIASIPFTVTQAGIPCVFGLVPTSANALSGVGSFTVAITNSNPLCHWSGTVINTNNWIIPKRITSGSFTYNVTVNPDPVTRTGYMIIADQLYTVHQAGSQCTYTLSEMNHTYGSVSDTGMVSVITGNGCAWTASNTNNWITFTSPTNLTSFGSVSYSVATNFFPTNRTGYLTVAGQLYTVTQLAGACAYTLTPGNSPTHNYAGDTGVVSVASFCSWSVIKTNSWITLLSGPSGTGNGTFSYSVLTNPTALVRTGVITLSGVAYTVTQMGAPCTYTISPAARVHSGLLETGIVNVASLVGCNWSVSNTNSWITLPSGTNGSGTMNIAYTVATNPVAIARTGVVMVAGLPYTVSQLGATCHYTILPISRAHGFAAATGTVTVATIGGCAWTVDNTNSWISIASNTNATNSGTVSYTLPANPTGLTRTGLVTIAGLTFTLSQLPAPCTFAISPTNRIHGSGSETGLVTVTSLIGCNWSVNNTNSWITINSGPVGTGSGLVSYTVLPNPNPGTRIGVFAIAGQSFTVTNLGGVSLVCPANKTVECGSTWDFDLPSATSICGASNITIQILTTVTNTLGSCGNTFTATRTWQANDTCGSFANCSQIVRVVDTTPPALICALNKTVEWGVPWSFDAPTATDICSAGSVTIQAVSTVTNASGCGNTFTTTQTWQVSDGCNNRATCSQVVSVVDTTPPILTCANDKGVICGTFWTFDAPTAFDLASGANVTITILSTVTNGNCQSFEAIRTWKASDQCSNSTTCSQTVTNAQVLIGGTVYDPILYPSSSPSDKRIAGLTLNLTGDANQSIQTAADGSYTLNGNAGGNFTVTPSLPNSNPAANGVTTVDISLIRRHILNIALLDSPYKLLAADVNGSRSVTTLDISWIRKMILGVTNIFPAGLWRLVPSDYVFPDPQNPWDAPSSRSYANLLVDQTAQDFLAIKLGDVNNSWAAPLGAKPLTARSARGVRPAQIERAAVTAPTGPEVMFQVSHHTNQPGETIAAQITVSGFRQVTSAQFTMAWDPMILQYEGTGGYALPGLSSGNYGTLLTNSGKLSFSWDDPQAAGVTLPDGTTIFTLSFKVAGSIGNVSPLNLVDTVAEREVGINFSLGTFAALNGQVTVGDALPSALPVKLTQGLYSQDSFSLPLTTIKGQHYILEFTDVLPGTNWTALPAVTGDGTMTILKDPAAPARHRFYRLRIQ